MRGTRITQQTQQLCPSIDKASWLTWSDGRWRWRGDGLYERSRSGDLGVESFIEHSQLDAILRLCSTVKGG
ncbi:hypothetical protein FACS1894158_07360 [Betaproteobacteria bacterium]|nr:hypothetical protein FACS1894158_07360 [Betaproteobacteria bacterium]